MYRYGYFIIMSLKLLPIFKTIDHCGQVESRCKEKETGNGPVTVRTPYGLGVDEWAEGLEKYNKVYQNLDGVDNYDIKK